MVLLMNLKFGISKITHMKRKYSSLKSTIEYLQVNGLWSENDSKRTGIESLCRKAKLISNESEWKITCLLTTREKGQTQMEKSEMPRKGKRERQGAGRYELRDCGCSVQSRRCRCRSVASGECPAPVLPSDELELLVLSLQTDLLSVRRQQRPVDHQGPLGQHGHFVFVGQLRVQLDGQSPLPPRVLCPHVSRHEGPLGEAARGVAVTWPRAQNQRPAEWHL